MRFGHKKQGGKTMKYTPMYHTHICEIHNGFLVDFLEKEMYNGLQIYGKGDYYEFLCFFE